MQISWAYQEGIELILMDEEMDEERKHLKSKRHSSANRTINGLSNRNDHNSNSYGESDGAELNITT